MADNAPSKETYNSSQISTLEGLEAVRKKPGMYIGGTDERALHHCVSEVLDNSVDEHLAGHCMKIEVVIHVDGSISIRDDGRGIPVDMHPQKKMPAVELVLTTLHSGGNTGRAATSSRVVPTASVPSASTLSPNGLRWRSAVKARSTTWSSNAEK